MTKTALLIIDVQVAMYSYDNLYLYEGEKVLNNIKSILEQARSSLTPAIFIQHTSNEEYEKGSDTWQICPEIAPITGEPIVEKPTWDAFHKTNLEEVLHNLDIENLIIVGMQSEFCLDTTCRRAFSLGYKNILVQDAHTTFDSAILSGEQIVAHHNSVLGGRFVKLSTTKKVLELLSSY